MKIGKVELVALILFGIVAFSQPAFAATTDQAQPTITTTIYGHIEIDATNAIVDNPALMPGTPFVSTSTITLSTNMDAWEINTEFTDTYGNLTDGTNTIEPLTLDVDGSGEGVVGAIVLTETIQDVYQSVAGNGEIGQNMVYTGTFSVTPPWTAPSGTYSTQVDFNAQILT